MNFENERHTQTQYVNCVFDLFDNLKQLLLVNCFLVPIVVLEKIVAARRVNLYMKG